MRKLLALLILSVSFFLGGTDFGFAEKTFDGAGEFVGTQTVAEEEVCIGPEAMLDYFRDPPNPMLSVELLDILEGVAAQEFVFQTNGSSMAPFIGFVYFFQAPEERLGQVLAMLADPSGCTILMSGERTVTPGKSAGLVLPSWKAEWFLRNLSAPGRGEPARSI